MDRYDKIAKRFDWLDSVYFAEKGRNPRTAVMEMLPAGRARVLDLCCGTLSNTLDIAQARPELEITGIDRSEGMLRAAERKVLSRGAKNVRLLCADAANTRLPGGSFDCVVIGLVLHECSPGQRGALLGEARRLLVPGGSLIVLEWERAKTLRQRVKFAPLYLGEILSSGDFKQFYESDKSVLLASHGFITERTERCNYTVVIRLVKIAAHPQSIEKSGLS